MQLKTVHTAPWPHCPNKNVFSNRLNWPYVSTHSLRLGGRLFQMCVLRASTISSRSNTYTALTLLTSATTRHISVSELHCRCLLLCTLEIVLHTAFYCLTRSHQTNLHILARCECVGSSIPVYTCHRSAQRHAPCTHTTDHWSRHHSRRVGSRGLP